MICYTYNTSIDTNGIPSLNKHEMTQEASSLVNHFGYGDLPGFYEELSGALAQMRSDGAEAIMLYIHWGEEYQIQPNETQKAMAQELCDMGIDVIVGNHAHVIQPVELLTNCNDANKKTLCLYSMGNALSNIRTSDRHPAHSEDGLLFQVTFAKYSDGTVILSDANLLPLWVNHHKNPQGKWIYPILPLDKQIEDWKTQFSLTDGTLQNAQASYDRTMAIVGSGMAEVDAYLSQNLADTEAALGVTGNK
jgi:poly-gamma-glutamate synthesis protein (capsule biosynthesis protein)